MKRNLHRRLEMRRLESRIAPATFTVMNLNDSGADSLRDCISKANAAAGADTVDFKSGLTGTITLTTGEIAINQDVTITALTSSKLIISGNNASRIFNTVVAPAGTAIAISGLTLTGGNSTNNSGGAIVTENETLTLDNCVFSGNTAKFSSGAIHSANGSTVIATSCSFINNTAGAFGGALDIFGAGSKTILKSCTLTGNSGTNGGALYAANYLLLENSTVASNVATTGSGGGIRLDGTGAVGTLTIRNSTISGNSCKTDGGGISLSSFAGPFNGTLVVQNATITNNTAATGSGGGGISRPSGTGAINIESTIVSGNIGIDPDIFSGGTVSVKTSAIGSGTGFTKTDLGGNLPFQPHANLKLGALADNGGPTLTHALFAGSPCVDSGSNPAPLLTDQRGFARVFGTGADMGAFEVNPQTFVVDQPTDENDGNFATGDLSLREALALANGFASTADSITFDTVSFQFVGKTVLTLGELTITAPVQITWPNQFPVTIDANSASRVFNIQGAPAGTPIGMTGLRLTGGKVSGSGGAILAGDESLTLSGCVLTANRATTSFGGAVAIVGDGSLTASDCQFTNNSASSSGGAICEIGAGAAKTILNRCTISGNAGFQGGGVYARSYFFMDGCAVFGNSAPTDTGGGIHLGQQLGTGIATIRNSTISGNLGEFGGGVALIITFGGTLRVQNCTITNNQSVVSGGGIHMSGTAGKIEITSSIVSGNTTQGTEPDIRSDGTVNVNFSAIGKSSGFTLTGANNLPFGTDLKLGPLQINGGSTPTHALLVGSPAVDKGSNPASLTSDQRGSVYKRSVGAAPDIGAYETAKVFLVTNTNDNGVGSFRKAIFDADGGASSADLIRFDPVVFSTPQTITLTTGQISIFDFLEIQGPGAGLLTITANSNSGLFFVGGTGTITDTVFSGLTLTGGKDQRGGAIDSVVQTTIIRDSVITGNSATLGGGGIALDVSTLLMERCTVTNNTATKYGGGLYFFSRCAFSVADSTISGNKCTSGQGGGLYFFNATYSPAVLRNSTVSGNSASLQGGGIALNFRGNLLVQNSTITKNTSTSFGGGIGRFGGQGDVTLQSTIVAQNQGMGGPDIDFQVALGTVFANNSLIGVANAGLFPISGLNNKTGTLATPLDAKLSPLGNFGGPTQTHLPLPGSPCLDAGSNSAGLTKDQRGFSRVVGTAADIGSVEIQPPPCVAGNAVIVNNGDAQRSRVTSVRVDFNQIVTLPGTPSTAFKLERLSDNGLVGLSASVTNDTATHVTLTFTGALSESGSLADGRYRLTVIANQVTGEGGQLDGDCNGVSGDNFVLVGDPATNKLFRLFGDADGNGIVDGVDFGAFRTAFNTNSSVFDFDGSGVVDGADFGQFRSRFGVAI